jgi:trans-2,3-dihydro-3-hydroxyanthranilate isomerase
MSVRTYRFATCDVFTTSRFEGNPLAVVPDGQGLSDEEMQKIAREFNYSETTFVLPPEQGHTYRLRIFTRKQELAFAGHPNIGSAYVLTQLNPKPGSQSTITFEQPAGPVAITVRQNNSGGVWCELKAPANLSLGDPQSAATVAAAIGLNESDIRVGVHPPREASVGKVFLVVEVNSREALVRAQPNTARLTALDASGVCASVMVYTRSNDEFDMRCRMFAPLGGTVEDSATGSAACALTGLLTHYEGASTGEFSWRMAQGVEMGRPSLLEARSAKHSGTVSGVWLAGNSVGVFEGRIAV